MEIEEKIANWHEENRRAKPADGAYNFGNQGEEKKYVIYFAQVFVFMAAAWAKLWSEDMKKIGLAVKKRRKGANLWVGSKSASQRSPLRRLHWGERAKHIVLYYYLKVVYIYVLYCFKVFKGTFL
ncbi:hypothetical protein LAG90_12245 [Marinilongibacter aquaticus]|uniref:hypothetical protein n=1 Tax=Marinilongibacter aquaticus TaxID=2975157 RepID=UPI0021BD2929|nr:hypothetical protein [Marinilongibacter aquaticus]UBM61048.1 hypothetical protein LAG90_12245 [Marinilongibacter aquaticus]